MRAAAQQGAATSSAPVAPMQLPSVVPLTAGTERPDEPLTAGLPFGPGAGAEVLRTPVLSALDKLKRMYRANPNPDLLELIILAEGD